MADGDDCSDKKASNPTVHQGEIPADANDKRTSLKRPHDEIIDCCQSSQKLCKRNKLKGFAFCDKHILEDKESPFQRCNFVSKTSGTSCTNPAPKRGTNKKSFCLVHTRNPNLKKALAHKIKKKKSKKSKHSDSKTDYGKGKQPHPNSKYEQNECEEVFDGESPNESNTDNRIETTWLGDQETDSDSIDSDEEDPLKYAGVWTLEEAMKILKDKMIRLRALYEGQFKRVEYMLKDRRRKYLHDSMSSEGGCCSTNPDDIHNNKRLHTALKHYQQLTGQDAALEKQAREKRTKGVTSHSKPSYLPRCHHIINGQRCQAKSMPLTKFCFEHICYDPSQLLYKPCSIDHSIDSNENCELPVLHINSITVCDKHVYVPPLTSSEAVAATLEFTTADKSDTSVDTEQLKGVVTSVNLTEDKHSIASSRLHESAMNIEKTTLVKEEVPNLIMPNKLHSTTMITSAPSTITSQKSTPDITSDMAKKEVTLSSASNEEELSISSIAVQQAITSVVTMTPTERLCSTISNTSPKLETRASDSPGIESDIKTKAITDTDTKVMTIKEKQFHGIDKTVKKELLDDKSSYGNENKSDDRVHNLCHADNITGDEKVSSNNSKVIIKTTPSIDLTLPNAIETSNKSMDTT